jgi:hypothetical protein
MRYRHQIWWNIIEFNEISSSLIRYHSSEFDEMLFIKCDEIHFVKFDETSLIKFDEMTLMFDESLSSRFNESFLSSINYFEKIRVRQSKHRRLNDQAWSQKRIHRDISAKEKIWSRISRSHFTFRDKMQNTLLTFSQQIASFERNILNLLQKRKIVRRKTTYNVFDRHFARYRHFDRLDRLRISVYQVRWQRHRVLKHHLSTMWCVSELDFMNISLRAKSEMNYSQNSSQLRCLRKYTFRVFWSHDQ